jgi:hypothetical protein
MTNIEQLIEARETAIEKVRAWWDAEVLAGRYRYQTEAPAWPEYLAAFKALDKAREAALVSDDQRSEAE